MSSYDEVEKIEVYLSCRNLPNMDTFSLTDTIIKVYQKNSSAESDWFSIG